MARPAAALAGDPDDDAAQRSARGASAFVSTGSGVRPLEAWSERSQELGVLLGRCGLGDRRAFADLYDKTSGYLFAVVLRIQRDRAVAEELLQEIYVTLWRQAAGFDAARSQPLTWLTHIARNRAIDSLRRAEAQPRSFSSLAPAGGGDADGDADDDALRRTLEAVPDEGAGPFELLASASEARELGRCMEHLSAAQRQSVALAFYDGLTHAEVAERLRQPLGTVKSWVRRALLTLKSCLDRAVQREQAGVPAGLPANAAAAAARPAAGRRAG
ncbi:MAG: sigma-70 family RNA polymerase sigma factor [Rubrivivax sp.]|nr:sigma-70 family RNA polymerase sigma factor [Rubrivivax sp.]